jgi:hypothetical protein
LAVQWTASIAKRFELTHRRQVVMLTKELKARIATFLLEERRHGEAGDWEVRLTQETFPCAGIPSTARLGDPPKG